MHVFSYEYVNISYALSKYIYVFQLNMIAKIT